MAQQADSLSLIAQREARIKRLEDFSLRLEEVIAEAQKDSDAESADLIIQLKAQVDDTVSAMRDKLARKKRAEIRRKNRELRKQLSLARKQQPT